MTEFRRRLSQQYPSLKLFHDPADCWVYGYDYSRQHALPDYVVFPTTHQQVQFIVQLCNQLQLPVVARGRGTGIPGGAVPIHHGVVLSTECMTDIIDFDPSNRLVRVQTGLVNRDLQAFLKPHGFFWAPDPSSAIACSIGGNLAYNSAGPRAVKYGSCRENTLALRAVTGLGESVNLGTNTSKGVVGYDLTRLIIGSEGTLAIITEATLKLTPLQPANACLQALYQSEAAAAEVVATIMAQAITPYALELMDSACLELLRKFGNLSIANAARGLLFIEIDGNEAEVACALTQLQNAAQHADLLSLELANTQAQQEKLWQARRALSPCLKDIAPKKINEDIVVPVSELAHFIDFTQDLAKRYDIHIVNFGHAGNGNLHVNLLIDPDDPKQKQHAEHCLEQIFNKVLQLGGTLSGEHGVGLAKQAFISQEIAPESLQLMQQIKTVFDPNAILNPGKMFPASQ